MLCKRLIPCLDVKDGRVVKGVRFVELRDAGDPVAAALAYDAQGADELVFLDITASHEGRATMLDVVAAHRRGHLHAAHGGRRDPVARGHPHAAARRAPTRSRSTPPRWSGPAWSRKRRARSAASASWWRSTQCAAQPKASRPWLGRRSQGEPSEYKSEASHRKPSWQVYTHGGRRPAGRDAVEWAREVETLGAGEILLTSMDRDGTGAGYDIALTRAVAEAVSVPVIASGGVGRLEHLREGLVEGRADAALVATLFHFGQHTVPEAKRYLHARGVPVRLEP